MTADESRDRLLALLDHEWISGSALAARMRGWGATSRQVRADLEWLRGRAFVRAESAETVWPNGATHRGWRYRLVRRP